MEKKNNEALSEENLKNVSGGYVHENENMQWYEVIDDNTGKVLDVGYSLPELAQSGAEKMGQSTTIISDEELAKLRSKNK